MSSQNHNREQLLDALRLALMRMGNTNVLFTHTIAGSVGLSATEFECLDKLGDAGPVSAGQLAEITGLTSGAVTGLVDRLERAGLARREADPNDRRKVIIHAVENREMLDKIIKLYQPVAQYYREIAGHYNDEQIATIVEFMNASIEATEKYGDELRRKMDGQ